VGAASVYLFLRKRGYTPTGRKKGRICIPSYWGGNALSSREKGRGALLPYQEKRKGLFGRGLELEERGKRASFLLRKEDFPKKKKAGRKKKED